MTTPADQQAADLLARAASFGLRTARLEPPPAALPTDQWTRLLALVRHERQWGPLTWAIADGWWPATDEQAEQALTGHRRAMATVLRIEQRLIEVHELFVERGIPVVVVKGPAVAHLDHDEPSLRSFGDLDLLVRAPDLRRVEDLLLAEGGRRRFDEPRPGFDERFSKGFSVRWPGDVEVDVHRTLAVGPFGLRIRPDDLIDRTSTFELGGTSFTALDRRGRFLHACVHAALGAATPAMTARRDVVAICDADDDHGALLDAIDLADSWGLGLVMSWAVHDAATTFDWRPPEPMCDRIDRIEPTARDWAWLDGYRGHRSSARHARDSLQAIDSWRDRIRYGAAAIAPGDRISAERVRRAINDLRA